MRLLKIGFGAFVAVTTASAAWAVQWIDIGTNSAIRPELQSGFSFCIDKDSVKTDSLGWTSYTFRLCSEPREIFESSVQCAQNLSAEQVPIRQRTLVANGKSTPDRPWKTELTYMSSVSGKLARFACAQAKPQAANAPAPKPGTMAADVLAHLEATKGYRELSALYERKAGANAAWPQSAEGRAVEAQLQDWRRDAAATAIVDGKDGRFLRYSVGGMTVTDAGIAVADLEKSRPYRETIAEAIAQNILTSPLDPKVKTALASLSNKSEASRLIKNEVEYYAYLAALNKTAPAEKASAIEAFVKRYPNSIVKLDALDQAMVAYQQVGSQDKVESTARRILAIDKDHVRALAIVVLIERTNATKAAANQVALAQLRAESERGLAAVPKWAKPDDMLEADFVKSKTTMIEVFAGAAGFAALQAKDYAGAQEFYAQAVALNPSDLQTVYQLGVAELEQSPPNAAGFWHIARAIHLADAAKNAAGVQAIERYGKAKYVRFHGGEDGWDALLKQAAANVDAPKGFAIKAAATPAELAVQAVKANDPATLSFEDLEFVLSLRDASPANKAAADRVWQFIQTLPRIKIHVKVIAATATDIEVAVSDDNQQGNKPDMQVVMAKPLAKPPAPGSYVDVVGHISEYKISPFKFIMVQGEI